MRRSILLSSLILSASLAVSTPFSVFADNKATNEIVMENCGAYLFEWRPVDYGNGHAFAILVGGNNIAEYNVILNRGYDYGYTFNPQKYPRPWGTVPDLVNVNGVWAIPDNQASLPEGIQPATRIVLLTNNKNMDTNERYIDVVHLPGNVDPSTLPPEVRKYLINVDGSDAGAYEGTITAGWEQDGDVWKYTTPDGQYVTNSWIMVDEKSYYMNEAGIMLADTITPDGIYVNPKGEKTSYFPGWMQNDKGWRYVMKNGYYAASTWIKDVDGRYYYFDMAGYMRTDYDTPDGYHVGPDGAWDGQAQTGAYGQNPGPGGVATKEDQASGATGNTESTGSWEAVGEDWKYKLTDGTYVTNAWKEVDGKWYYFNEASLMMKNQTTPDGYQVGEDGVWIQ